MFRRLMDWIVPNEALSGIGHVHWRIADAYRTGVQTMTVGGQQTVSVQLLEDAGWWFGPRHTWKAWPSLEELIYQSLVDAFGSA